MSAWISLEEAAQAATNGVLRLGSAAHPVAAGLIKTDRAGAPYLVERLDDPARAYYLVPFFGTGGISMVVRIDAQSGALAELSVLQPALPFLILSPDDAARAASAFYLDKQATPGRLVWRPCRESPSPQQPLYEVTVNNHTVYVAMDGSVFDNLTWLGKGGG